MVGLFDEEDVGRAINACRHRQVMRDKDGGDRCLACGQVIEKREKPKPEPGARRKPAYKSKKKGADPVG